MRKLFNESPTIFFDVLFINLKHIENHEKINIFDFLLKIAIFHAKFIIFELILSILRRPLEGALKYDVT